MFVFVCVTFHVDVQLQAKMLAEMDKEFGIALKWCRNKVIITCACGACDDHVLIM